MAEALFFDPRKEAEVKRKRALAQQLMKQSEQTPNEMVSGIVVKKSPIEGLAKALTAGVAGYQSGQAERAVADDSMVKQKILADAIGKYGQDPQAAAQMLMQSPATSDTGMQMYMSDIDRQRDMELMQSKYAREDAMWEKDAGLQRELMQARASIGGGGGGGGAIESLTDRILQENPRITFMEALSIAQKSTGQGAYRRPDGSIGILGENYTQQLPQDPSEAHANAVQQRQLEIGNNPYQRDNLLSEPQNGQQPINYADVNAQIAGQKKAAEEMAALKQKFVMNPLIEAATAKEQNLASIDKTRLESLNENAQAVQGQLSTFDQIEGLINQGTLGNSPADRVAMAAHYAGVGQTPETINTANLLKLGNQLVLSRGSLGAGVSVSDADRYDKAAGDFSKAQSNNERLQYIKIMREIALKYANKANQEMQQYRQTGVMPIYNENQSIPVDQIQPMFSNDSPVLIQPGTIEEGYRFKGGNPSDPNSWEAVR